MTGKLRFLLLQARLSEDPEREGERRLFAERLGVDEARVSGYDLLERAPNAATLRAHDAILVGGSGDFYLSSGRFPDQERLFDVLRRAVDGPTPIFASCFGFQLLTAALGGEIIHDPESMELGTFELELTAAGRSDELFGVLPPRFLAQLGHKDRALRLPDDASLLATSERSPLQALRYRDRPVWATQFHPELDAATNLRRYEVYGSGYAAYLDEIEREAVRSRFRESPETALLLPRFVELMFG